LATKIFTWMSSLPSCATYKLLYELTHHLQQTSQVHYRTMNGSWIVIYKNITTLRMMQYLKICTSLIIEHVFKSKLLATNKLNLKIDSATKMSLWKHIIIFEQVITKSLFACSCWTLKLDIELNFAKGIDLRP